MSKHLPILNHNTMLTNYDLQIKDYEIDIIDNYVVSNNISDMNLHVFKNIVCNTLPMWRAEQLTGSFFQTDDGQNNYKKYITYNK